MHFDSVRPIWFENLKRRVEIEFAKSIAHLLRERILHLTERDAYTKRLATILGLPI